MKDILEDLVFVKTNEPYIYKSPKTPLPPFSFKKSEESKMKDLEKIWEDVILSKEPIPLYLKLLTNLSLLVNNRKGYRWMILRKDK